MNNHSNLRKIIPNSLTALSLMAGCFSILLSFQGQLKEAALLIFIGAFLDFFDGFLARLLNACSEFGKNLDSLADMTSFGVAPAFLLFHLQIRSVSQIQEGFTLSAPVGIWHILIFSPFLIALFSALRLARFNTSQAGDTDFTGLSVTPSAIFIASLTLWILFNDTAVIWMISHPYALSGIAVLISALLISPFKMFSLKVKTFRIRDNLIQYCYVFLSLGLLIVLKFGGLAASILLYVLMSLIFNGRKKKEVEKEVQTSIQ